MVEKDEQRNIQVAVRVRPNSRRELEMNQRTIIKILDNTTLLFDPEEEEDEFFYHGVKQNHRDITKRVNKKLSMEFDRIFDQEATNDDVFNQCTKPLIDSVMNGYNCSVFVYGATGAGKTFTMLGNEECRGLTFLTMQELFRKITEISDTRKFDVAVSYLEVYNEQVMNLITKTGPLKLREDSNGVVVSGLALTPIHNADELIELLLQGNKNRTQHPTDANAESSRSHAIFQVHIRMTEKKTGQKRTVKLSMIDLAGSERAASTKGIGLRFKEGASINKSLLALGNCINKLADGLKHIPYRDSNLTRILKDSLGGNCQTLMIANVSPSSLTFEDTYNTLKYASRAKKIRTTVRQNVMKTNMPKEYYVKKVYEQSNEVEKLKQIIKQLEAEKLALESKEQNNGFDETELKTWIKKIDLVYAALIKTQENYYAFESKEKILAFRKRLKNFTEMNKKALILFGGEKMSDDISRVEASIDRFSKQIESQKDEMNRWKNRYEECTKDLEKISAEIKGSKYANVLYKYLQSKDSEVEASRLHIKYDHIRKVQSLELTETGNIHKMLLYSLAILERNYLILRANKLIDKELEEMITKLIRMTSSTSHVKFDELQNNHDIDEVELGVTEIHLSDNIESNTNATTNTSNNLFKTDIKNGIKRKLVGFDNYKELLFKKNKDKQNSNEFPTSPTTSTSSYSNGINGILLSPHYNGSNLNETRIISNFADNVGDSNSTFLVPGIKRATNSNNNYNNNDKRTEMLKNILTDSNNVNVRNGPLLSKVLTKSTISAPTLLSRVAAVTTINKENKKFSPNRIRKSPRSIANSKTNRALNSAAKNFINNQQRFTHNTHSPPKTNTIINSVNNGRVRLNRAASMRTKRS